MSKKLSFGLVGAGAIAQAYGQAFPKAEYAQLVAVADVRPEAAKNLAQVVGARSYTSYEKMAETEKLDGVIICTPPSTHPDICLHFIEKGINVLCEKPFSIDSRSAYAMRDAARKAGVLITMASKFRYVQDVIRAKSIVESGILGEIVLFENAFTARVDMSERWNANPVVSGGGVLMDNGTHSVDIMRYLLGPIAQLQVVEGKRIQGLDVEDTAQMFVMSESGVRGSIDLSWSLNKELDYFIRIYGSQGTISVGWKESKYRQASSPDWIVFGTGYNKVQAFCRQLDNFSQAIQADAPLLITVDDAIASVEVLETAYAALPQSHWVSVAPLKMPVAIG
ncbi:Gfo/Idh/MocA family oxidoreductase [Spirulina subsalsa FACHB-351]|uniref:Gfo/Idh/MocA family oxidoreductase n=1 Tax=Spirulina subsalsa FACHB-351 TaxID=234711 RepID=A0ABT3L364_9CYAN|nr:Gfo/Idh/MocA family oxidoreductase [Spirulina subsalsa]MCW6035944.1 Gfo/Idh/MocA family oxidoreductase [Spirulina subsalsa FACHB-351]